MNDSCRKMEGTTKYTVKHFPQKIRPTDAGI